ANDAQAADTLVKSNSSQGLLRTALGEAGKKPPDLKPRVITRYTDTKTDRYILVAEGTSQEDALARLQEAAKVESDTAMVNLLRAHHKEGLISTRLKLQNIGKNGTDVILSWGDIHRKYKPSSSLTNYRDSSTGRSISVR